MADDDNNVSEFINQLSTSTPLSMPAQPVVLQRQQPQMDNSQPVPQVTPQPVVQQRPQQPLSIGSVDLSTPGGQHTAYTQALQYLQQAGNDVFVPEVSPWAATLMKQGPAENPYASQFDTKQRAMQKSQNDLISASQSPGALIGKLGGALLSRRRGLASEVLGSALSSLGNAPEADARKALMNNAQQLNAIAGMSSKWDEGENKRFDNAVSLGKAHNEALKAREDFVKDYVNAQRLGFNSEARQKLEESQVRYNDASSLYKNQLASFVAPEKTRQMLGQDLKNATMSQALPWVGPQAAAHLASTKAGTAATLSNAQNHSVSTLNTVQHTQWLQEHWGQMTPSQKETHLDALAKDIGEQQALYSVMEPEQQKEMAPLIIDMHQRYAQLQGQAQPQQAIPVSAAPVVQRPVPNRNGLVPPPPPSIPIGQPVLAAPAAGPPVVPPRGAMVPPPPNTGPSFIMPQGKPQAQANQPLTKGYVAGLVAAIKGGDQKAKAEALIKLHQLEQMGTPQQAQEPAPAEEDE